ncbi:MAG: helix-turn-helix transcriptional regulator [Oscillospiraceae bacterium]|nr:helix-turn-helix transcriptional regulator [Oscillospiraceae bacterium]
MEEDIKIEIGQILLDLRRRKGYSQAKIAKYLGITTAAYQNYEAGRREMNYTNIHKLADFYNVTIDYLLAREPKKEIDPIELLPVDDWKKALLRLYIAMDSESRPEMIEIIKKIASSVDVQDIKKPKLKSQIQKSKIEYQATIEKEEFEDEKITREQPDKQAKRNTG